MRIPSFVPMIESQRRARERVGFVVELFTWGYIALVFCRFVLGKTVMGWIEDRAYDEPPKAWAAQIIERFQYDSRYFALEWPTVLTIFAVGAFIGALVSMTGKGFGFWIASITKLQVNKPEDSIRIEKHWKWARIEGLIVLILTIWTGIIVTKIDVFKAFDAMGLYSAGRLGLLLGCGVPGVGEQGISVFGHTIVNFHGSFFDLMQWFLNHFVSIHNWMGSHLGWSTVLEPYNLMCTPTDSAYMGEAAIKLVESIYLAFMATVISVPVAFVLAFLASRNLTRHSRLVRSLYTIIRLYINITRSIEPLIWAILFSVWVGIGPFAGSIALMMHTVSSLVKQYSEAIESVDEGPLEAIAATGSSRVAQAWFSVVPQVLLPYLSFTIYRWDINVRMATIIGLVGGGGIGQILMQEQGLAHWDKVGSIAFLIFLVVWSMDFLSAKVREAIH